MQFLLKSCQWVRQWHCQLWYFVWLRFVANLSLNLDLSYSHPFDIWIYGQCGAFLSYISIERCISCIGNVFCSKDVFFITHINCWLQLFRFMCAICPYYSCMLKNLWSPCVCSECSNSNMTLMMCCSFQQNEGIIVLGATNRRDNLDRWITVYSRVYVIKFWALFRCHKSGVDWYAGL